MLVGAPKGVLDDKDDAHKDSDDQGNDTEVQHLVADVSLQVLEAARVGETLGERQRVVEEAWVANATAGVLALEIGHRLHAEVHSFAGWDSCVGSSAVGLLSSLSFLELGV